jgi:ABC-type glycerol-3-phosphate transport system substrate-binding protein
MVEKPRILKRCLQTGILLCFLLTACNPGVEDSTPLSTLIQPSQTSELQDTTPLPEGSTSSVTIWIPTLIGPDTEAGTILSEHLTLLEEANPQIEISLRVKAENGVSGILETLSAARFAAPSTLPDIVVLGPNALNAAALKGLISPLNEILEIPQMPEWYEYAISAAYVDGMFMGIPFASEAKAFAYRREAYETEPRKWADLLGNSQTLLLPLGEEGAALTLLLYKEMGGSTEDKTGYPTLDSNVLGDIFKFYTSANEAGILPLFTLQLDSPEDTWNSLEKGYGNSAIIPLKSYLDGSLDETYIVTPWPTRGGLGIIPTRSLSWAVVQKTNADHDLLAQVLQWLQEPGFLAQLAFTMGSLPVRSTSLDEWPQEDQVSTISRLIRVAFPEPSVEELATFGSYLQTAIGEVLNKRSTPEEAAEYILDQITPP